MAILEENHLILNLICLNHQKLLKDYVYQFQHKKEIFDLLIRHNDDLNLAKKKSFFNNYTIDIFLFITAIIS